MNFFIGPLRRFDRRRVHVEVEEELQFHLDLLTAEHCRQEIPWEEARDMALNRFGNMEQIRDECVEIARRNHPVIAVLQWFFGFVFLSGFLVRGLSTEYHVTRVGHVLIAVGILSQLLLYLRGLNPSRYASKPDDLSLIKLNDSESLAAFDRCGRTPVERMISYK